MIMQIGRRYVALARVSYCIIRRHCLSTAANTQQPATNVIDKEALSKLRKSTGYSFLNCRNALLQFGAENLTEAEKWLHNLAKKEGWQRATKVGNRAIGEGLLGIATSRNNAAVVEIGCETDFSANSDTFKSLVEKVAEAALNSAKTGELNWTENCTADKILKVANIDIDSLKTKTGQSINDLLAVTIATIKEKIHVNSVRVFSAPKSTFLAGYTHPKHGTDSVRMGHFGSLVALGENPQSANTDFSLGEGDSQPTLSGVGDYLCQHIVGMNPTAIGLPPNEADDHQVEKEQFSIEESNLSEDVADQQSSGDLMEDELNAFNKEKTTQFSDEETLLRQDFMLNPSQTVHDFLQSRRVQVVDFYRIERGHATSEDTNTTQNMDPNTTRK